MALYQCRDHSTHFKWKTQWPRLLEPFIYKPTTHLSRPLFYSPNGDRLKGKGGGPGQKIIFVLFVYHLVALFIRISEWYPTLRNSERLKNGGRYREVRYDYFSAFFPIY